MNTGFIDKLRAIDAVVAKYEDVTSGMADTVRSECAVSAPEKMQEEIAGIAAADRLLSIGIIGRVKAGKSSLLNSLFFGGKGLLPKAATPMTAALTIIRYDDSPRAEVELFTQADAATLKKEHDEFAALRQKRIDEKLAAAKANPKKRDVDPVRIASKVDSELSQNPKQGSWDQYERMQQSGMMNNVYSPTFKDVMPIAATSIDDLMGKLSDYVSAGGRYMPFTKSMMLYLNIPELRDIQIVDTPGVNDPVKSREKRTEDFLGQCDAVFVVSSAGEFISQEDLDLMAHVSGKKGVNQVFLVASRSDQQLYGSIKDDVHGSLPDAVRLIHSQLSSHAIDVFKDKRKQNPECAEMYDMLINEMDKRVVITSAVCHALMQHLDDPAIWDADMKWGWQLLNEDYPDYFGKDAAGESLKLISGVDKVKDDIAGVRAQKDDIIAGKQEKYAAQQRLNVAQYLQGMRHAVQEAASRLQETDAAQLKKRIADKEKLRARASMDVDEAFDEAVYRFKSDLSATLKQNSRGLFDGISDFSAYDKTETKTRTVQRKREKSDFFSGLWRAVGCTDWGYEYYDSTESYEVRTLQTAPIKRKLNDVVQGLQEDLVDSAEKAVREWRAEAQSKIMGALRAAIGDDAIDIPIVKTSIRKVIGNMTIPDFNLSSSKFATDYSGILKDDDEIEEFLEQVDEYKSNLRSSYSTQIRKFLSEMEKSAKQEPVSSLLFGSMDAELADLEKQIANKEATLARFQQCLAELAALES